MSWICYLGYISYKRDLYQEKLSKEENALKQKIWTEEDQSVIGIIKEYIMAGYTL